MAKGSKNWIWWTLGGLTLLGIGVGIYVFVKNRKEKKSAESSTETDTTNIPASSTTTASSSPSLPSTPFKNNDEGNKFRSWVNDKYPSYAKEIQLDRVGSKYNNTTIRKAWAKYGAEYQKSAVATSSNAGVSLQQLKTLLENGGKTQDIKIDWNNKRVRGLALDGTGFGVNNIYINLYENGYAYLEDGTDRNKKQGKWSVNGSDLVLDIEGKREEGQGGWAAYYIAKKLYPNVKDFTGFFYG
jgi:hypothetical protein